RAGGQGCRADPAQGSQCRRSRRAARPPEDRAVEEHMAEIATIARPYAEALYKSAGNDLNGAAQWLDALAAVAGNEQLLQFAGSPKVTDGQVFDVVAD